MKRYLAKRVVVTVLVIALVVAAAASIPMITGPSEPRETTYSEYEPDAVLSEPTPASGEIEPAPDAENEGTVLIDSSRSNRFSREDIAPLIRAFDRVGYEVRFHERGEGSLEPALATVDAVVVIDPAEQYSVRDAEALDEFTDAGGRLLVLAEPNRITVDVLGTTATSRSELSTLEAQFDLHADTQYVYDMDANDGNYKHVVATPSDRTDLDRADRVTLYTAAEIRMTDSGTAVLETAPTAQTSGSDQQRTRTVAAVNGNVMMIGDATLIRDDRYNVGDNNEFLADVVEFLVAGDGSDYGSTDEDETDTENGEDSTHNGDDTQNGDDGNGESANGNGDDGDSGNDDDDTGDQGNSTEQQVGVERTAVVPAG